MYMRESISSATMRATFINHQHNVIYKEIKEDSNSYVKHASLEDLETKGIAISRLMVTKCDTALYGRPTYILYSMNNGVWSQLPSHSFSSGSSVKIWENTGYKSRDIILALGIISRVTPWEIELVTIDEESSSKLENYQNFVQIHKSECDVMYERIKYGLNKVWSGGNTRCSHLLSVLFKESEPITPSSQVSSRLLKDGVLDLYNEGLDESQVDAVKFALTSEDLAVIHGPPGTGKTTTLIEIILQHVKLGIKVLAVAPSNLAVDNLVERLMKVHGNVVRIGHPARATQQVQQRTLDALIQNRNDEKIQSYREKIQFYLDKLKGNVNRNSVQRLHKNIGMEKEKIKKREDRLSKLIIIQNDVVLTTVTNVAISNTFELIPKEHFGLTVIDECSQSIECACYMAVMKSPKLLIAGDHQQLPPTVMSKEAAEEGLSISLMERIIDMYGELVTKMLRIQYRMNNCIMNWASAAMYNGQLRAHESVRDHLLCHMNGVARNKDTENALILIDTAGTKFENASEFYESKSNKGEAAILIKQMKRLIMSGVQERDIAVISPYNGQVKLIKKLLWEVHPAVEVQSIDGFQGREKEAILISLVRSNQQNEIGFLSEDRRLNVAVTRARRHLTLVCDSNTVCRHPFIKTLVDYMSANGVVKSCSAFEYEIDIPPRFESNIVGKNFSTNDWNRKNLQNNRNTLSMDWKSDPISFLQKENEVCNVGWEKPRKETYKIRKTRYFKKVTRVCAVPHDNVQPHSAAVAVFLNKCCNKYLCAKHLLPKLHGCEESEQKTNKNKMETRSCAILHCINTPKQRHFKCFCCEKFYCILHLPSKEHN